MYTRTLLLMTGLLFLNACSRTSVHVGESEKGITQVVNTAMPTGGKIDDPDHGKEVWLGVGAVSGTADTPANGVAAGHYLEDGTYFLGLQVNIYAAPRGSFYEVWIAPSDDKQSWIPFGHLTNPVGDVRHTLNAHQKGDFRKKRKIIITQELDDGNPDPSEVVAEAELIPRTR